MNDADADRTLKVVRGMFVALVLIVGVFLLVVEPIWTSIALILGIGLFVYLIVYIHARSARYTCKVCKRSFKISTWIDLSSPHWFDTKLLRCPLCGTIAWHSSK